MSGWKYHVSIWQNTVAPEDPTAVALAVEDWINKLAADGWEIIQVDTHPMANNIFRAIIFCRKSMDVIKSEEAAAAEKAAAEKAVAEKAAEPAPAPEVESDDESPARGKRHR